MSKYISLSIRLKKQKNIYDWGDRGHACFYVRFVRVGCVAIIMFTVILISSGCNINKSFNQAKDETVKFFEKNQSDFETAKDIILTAKSADNISIKSISYISFDTVETSDIITFDYDAQGMLGGQYWGIIYSSDDIPRIDNSIPDLTESETKGLYYWAESSGNNTFAVERIVEGWFFYYLDYDGHLNISNPSAKSAAFSTTVHRQQY